MDVASYNQLLHLMEAQLQAEAAAAGTVKRDNDNENHFHGHLSDWHSQHSHTLPDQEKATYEALMAAAQTNTVTQWIETHGYGPIFGLIEHMDYRHGNDLLNKLQDQLNKEAAAAGPAK